MSPQSPELVALLNACRARPADDMPRLVLADWLEENNDAERAEFIRIQCELARPTLDTERTAALKQIEKELVLANWQRWVGDLPEIMYRGSLAEARAQRAEILRQHFPSQSVPEEFTVPMRIDPFAPRNLWGFRRGLLWVDVKDQQLEDERFIAWCRGPQVVWLERAHWRAAVESELSHWELFDVMRPYLALSERLRLEPVMHY